ncbi:MAG: SDR family NAD(P)-dependent oxidoreductase, partial [Polyangiaceae bacterium]|nr:SDR family NAD(P)-dependent oxidoreductase [Polyangiaceae bacterium]
GLDLILIARRTEPLESEAQLLRRRHRVQVETVSLDLASSDLVGRFEAAIEGKDIGLLVYNACFSDIGEFLSTGLESKMKTLDVNCRGPLALTSVVGERLVARGRGGLLLMSSLSGLQGTAMVSTYAASKAFDTVLGESLWAELKPKGVDVLVCIAGATSTPNFNAQTPKEKRAQVFPMTPEDVARGALANLDKGPVYIPGAMNRLVSLLGRVIGRKLAIELISKNTRKLYA